MLLAVRHQRTCQDPLHIPQSLGQPPAVAGRVLLPSLPRLHGIMLHDIVLRPQRVHLPPPGGEPTPLLGDLPKHRRVGSGAGVVHHGLHLRLNRRLLFGVQRAQGRLHPLKLGGVVSLRLLLPIGRERQRDEFGTSGHVRDPPHGDGLCLRPGILLAVADDPAGVAACAAVRALVEMDLGDAPPPVRLLFPLRAVHPTPAEGAAEQAAQEVTPGRVAAEDGPGLPGGDLAPSATSPLPPGRGSQSR